MISNVLTLCLKILLVNVITVFTSIYYESYCKIPARSNKSIPWSYYHKTHLYVKGILNQNKRFNYVKIRLHLACLCQFRPLPEMTPLPECQPKFICCYVDQKHAKGKNLYIIFFWWWGHNLHVPPPPMSLFVTDFGCHLPPYPGDVIFE